MTDPEISKLEEQLCNEIGKTYDSLSVVTLVLENLGFIIDDGLTEEDINLYQKEGYLKTELKHSSYNVDITLGFRIDSECNLLFDGFYSFKQC